MPDVVVEEKLRELDAELTQAHPVPPVPFRGDNDVLVNWSTSCAASARALNDQMTSIRNVQRSND